MSFRCDCCGHAQLAGTRPVKMVMVKRFKSYQNGNTTTSGHESKRESNVGPCCVDFATEAETPEPSHGGVDGMSAPDPLTSPMFDQEMATRYFSEQ